MNHTDKGRLMTGIILETFRLNGLLVSEGDLLINELGLTSARWKVLGALSNEVDAMTVSDIARTMGQSRQAVQRLSNEMLQSGILEAVPNPQHQRAKLMKLTGKGKQAYELAMQKQIPWVNSLANNFKERELKQVSAILEKLIRELDR